VLGYADGLLHCLQAGFTKVLDAEPRTLVDSCPHASQDCVHYAALCWTDNSTSSGAFPIGENKTSCLTPPTPVACHLLLFAKSNIRHLGSKDLKAFELLTSFLACRSWTSTTRPWHLAPCWGSGCTKIHWIHSWAGQAGSCNFHLDACKPGLNFLSCAPHTDPSISHCCAGVLA
jgi:hypothetical protein